MFEVGDKVEIKEVLWKAVKDGSTGIVVEIEELGCKVKLDDIECVIRKKEIRKEIIESKILSFIHEELTLVKEEKDMKKGWLESKIVTSNTVDGERQIIELNDSVCFIPVTTDGYHILCSQYRASEGEENISMYGGYQDGDESVIATATREAFEECNINSEDIERSVVMWDNIMPSKGICTEKNSCVVLVLNKSLEELDLKSNDANETVKPVPMEVGEFVMHEATGMKTVLMQTMIMLSTYQNF